MKTRFGVVVVAIAVTVGFATAAFGQSCTDDPLTVGTPATGEAAGIQRR
jgi:hypothetical protein